MERYKKKETKWLINKQRGLFLTRRSKRRFAEQQVVADKILDRLVHSAHRFEQKGENLRKKVESCQSFPVVGNRQYQNKYVLKLGYIF